MHRLLPSPETVFDPEVRLERLSKLRANLGLSATHYSVEPVMSDLPSIGIEIETTWDQIMSDMHEEWLNSDTRPSQLHEHSLDYVQWAKRYNNNDRILKPLLQSITPVIPRVGFDAYWEFSFNPTKSITPLAAELAMLYESGIRRTRNRPLTTGLLSEGIPYATHMTIAGITNDRDAFTILCNLEQAGGSSPERIEKAMSSKKGSWAQKGYGGLRRREAYELQGADTSAYEFRTLICTSAEQMTRLLHLGQKLAHTCLTNPTEWRDIQLKTEDTLRTNGLPLSAWGHPNQQPEIWNTYASILETSKKESA